MFEPVNPREDLIGLENKILKFWKENKTFERSIQNRAEAPLYSFFDGPPFATGVPHYGTILSSVAKDVVPRYFTMKGFRIDRRWGWDCHGLPAEHMVEKKLGLKSKDEIETKIGIEKFNAECREAVTQMADEWEEVIDKIGRWVDYKNAYRTMDASYMESVWWAFKELYSKDLIYEDTRISLYCPRCETPLSNFEIAMDNSYEDITDRSVFVKFKITAGPYAENSLLVWTTTPWTLPANTALAVGKKITYLRVKTEKRETLIIAKDLVSELEGKYVILEEIKGKDLVGLSYIPSFSGFSCKNGKADNLHKVFSGDFVFAKEGTGIVHIAPAFGEDDFNLAQKEDIPLIDNLDGKARYKEGSWAGEYIFEANPKIIDELSAKKILYKEKEITHSYPFCHRCHTKLIYKTQPAWFVKISDLKEKLVAANEEINWRPQYLKHGRFGKGLASAPDWNISRDRYWGTPLPVWRCDTCRQAEIMGSYEELYQLSGQKLEDYHRPFIDNIDFKCQCGGVFKRIPQVLDSWFESGSMPYAERHYPFENKEDFTKKFPADYISEYISQTRAWFYVLHVLAVALFGKPAFKNVVATGIIAGEDGRKMSKSLGNYTDPKKILEQYGGDALRFYLMSSPLMEAKNLNFLVKDIAEVKRKVIATFWNSYSFFVTYANVDHYEPKELPIGVGLQNILDRWVLAELHLFIKNFEEKMEDYRLTRASRLIGDFLDKLSNWYIRRSRRRFWKSENDTDKDQAYATLYDVLVKLSQVMAPLMPFVAETVYKNLTQKESVHLTDFPKWEKSLIDESLLEKMALARRSVTLALAIRAKEKIKARKPLLRMFVSIKALAEDKEIAKIIAEEVNVKEVFFREKESLKPEKEIKTAKEEDLAVGLDTEITPELKLEGEAREIIRLIQEMRRQAGYEVDNHIVIGYGGGDAVFNSFGYLIVKETLADELKAKKLENPDQEKKLSTDSGDITLTIKKA